MQTPAATANSSPTAGVAPGSPVPVVCVVIAENRHDPQRNKQVCEAHRLADGKQLPLAKQGLRAVAERQQRAAEQDEANRVVHAQPVGAPPRDVAGFRAEPVAQRQQKKRATPARSGQYSRWRRKTRIRPETAVRYGRCRYPAVRQAAIAPRR